jgi:hypothetical protein
VKSPAVTGAAAPEEHAHCDGNCDIENGDGDADAYDEFLGGWRNRRMSLACEVFTRSVYQYVGLGIEFCRLVDTRRGVTLAEAAAKSAAQGTYVLATITNV